VTNVFPYCGTLGALRATLHELACSSVEGHCHRSTGGTLHNRFHLLGRPGYPTQLFVCSIITSACAYAVIAKAATLLRSALFRVSVISLDQLGVS
jgi:hypothetical protein